jgi:hypothetical protein
MGGSFSFQNLPCSRSMCSTLQHLYKVGKGYCIITDFLVVLFLGFEPMIRLPTDLFLILLVTIPTILFIQSIHSILTMMLRIAESQLIYHS